jgi:hypothetical protein
MLYFLTIITEKMYNAELLQDKSRVITASSYLIPRGLLISAAFGVRGDGHLAKEMT